MKRVLVVFVLLTLFAVAALPALAGAASADNLAAPGWRQMFPTTVPLARNDHAMAYDSTRGVAVLFGGTDGWTVFDDTWEWSSTSMSWSQKSPVHVPPRRYGHAMVYDEAQGVVVLFGGNGPGVGDYMNDTYLWDGSDWTEAVTADAPEGRWLHAMAYDPNRQVVVLHSGQQTSTQGPYGDTWEYANGNWVEQQITNPTPARSGAGMAYDHQRQVMVLFGGDGDNGELNETFERTGSGDWVQVFPNRSPAQRDRFGSVYYEHIGRTFIFGGLGDYYLNDTAVYNGQTWQGKIFNPSPSTRCCLAMVYDTSRQAVFLFAGAVNGNETADSWYFR
ncbi:MAG: kelch repeat-containing protein [Chloroflexota bacterium]